MQNRCIFIFLIISSLVGGMVLAQQKGTNISDDSLTPKQLADFRERCKQKVEEFQKYLPIIADKTRDEFDRSAAIKAAKSLFDDSSTIQLSSVNNTKIVTYTIGQYLILLRDTQMYAQIKITFYEMARLSEFTQEPDGSYSGNASVFQKFTGYDKKGRAVYQDLTQKRISTQVNPMSEFYKENRWTVLLGNISVVETTRVPGM